MAQPTSEKTAMMSREDLIALIQELRKPVKTEKEIREEQQAVAEREAMMETLKRDFENKQIKIKTCSHMRSNGSTTSVYIVDLNKLYCQACAGWIDPYQQPELFNKLYQLAI